MYSFLNKIKSMIAWIKDPYNYWPIITCIILILIFLFCVAPWLTGAFVIIKWIFGG